MLLMSPLQARKQRCGQKYKTCKTVILRLPEAMMDLLAMALVEVEVVAVMVVMAVGFLAQVLPQEVLLAPLLELLMVAIEGGEAVMLVVVTPEAATYRTGDLISAWPTAA
jgi:hypothetical protein